MSHFPTEPAAVEASWIEARLRAAGALGEGRITGLTWEPVGAGQVGDSARFHLRYDREDVGPASVVGKFPAADATSRQTAGAFRLYVREVLFYRELRALFEVRAPRTYATELDEASNTFVLLFEDLGPARAGDQLAGCRIGDARAAIRQAASFHAPSRNNPSITGLDWLQPNPDATAQVASLYGHAHTVFRDRYDGVLAPEILRVCDALKDASGIWFGRRSPDPGFVHGDFRLDNMLFDIKGGAEEIAVVDWQTTQLGSGLIDIGYFLGCGVGSDLRRPHERELLELYCEEMGRRGVRLTVDDIWDEYRIGALHGLSTAVFSAAFVERTPRGDKNFLSMARGAAELALDHDSIGALRRWAARG